MIASIVKARRTAKSWQRIRDEVNRAAAVTQSHPSLVAILKSPVADVPHAANIIQAAKHQGAAVNTRSVVDHCRHAWRLKPKPMQIVAVARDSNASQSASPCSTEMLSLG
jgi:hypothetical protein